MLVAFDSNFYQEYADTFFIFFKTNFFGPFLFFKGTLQMIKNLVITTIFFAVWISNLHTIWNILLVAFCAEKPAEKFGFCFIKIK